MDDPVVCMTECKKSEWWSKLPSRHEIEFLLLLPLSFSSFHSLLYTLCTFLRMCTVGREYRNMYEWFLFPYFLLTVHTLRTGHRVKIKKSWSNLGYILDLFLAILGHLHFRPESKYWSEFLKNFSVVGKSQIRKVELLVYLLGVFKLFQSEFCRRQWTTRQHFSLLDIWIRNASPQKPNYNLAFRGKIGHV